MAFAGYEVGSVRLGWDTNTNETGMMLKATLAANVVKGELLSCYASGDNRYIQSPSGFDAVLVAYENGSTNDTIWAWKIGASRCQILLKDGEAATRGYVALGDDVDGRIYTIAVPSSNPVAAEHFREVGHVCESKNSGTNVLIMVDTHAN